MIYIRIELWPMGSRSRSQVLGEAKIANVGGDEFVGNYVADLSKKGGFKARPKIKGYLDPEAVRVMLPRESSVWKQVNVEGFRRKRLGVWHLLFRVLEAASLKK